MPLGCVFLTWLLIYTSLTVSVKADSNSTICSGSYMYVCLGENFSCNCPGCEWLHNWIITYLSGQSIELPISITSEDFVGEMETDNSTVFTATVTALDANTISSKLSFTVSSDMNGTNIVCSSGNTIIVNTTIILHSPAQTIIQRALYSDIQDGGNPTSRNVTLRWTVSDNTNISRCIISCTALLPDPPDPPNPSNPPDPQCDSDIVLPAGGVQVRENYSSALLSVEYVFVVGVDVEYSITVRTDNCGNRQNGTESKPLTLALRAPGTVKGLHPNPLYSNLSGDLLTLNMVWDKVADSVVTGVEGVTGNVQYYTITVSSISEAILSSSECEGGRCSYDFNATGLILPSQVSVSVAAVNGIGSGLAHQPLLVGSNKFFNVSVEGSDNAIGWQVTCFFLSAFPGSDATCRIDYGTDSSYTNLPYSDESTEAGGANDSVSIQLQRLNSTATYYYRVSAIESGDHTITVQGSFTTGTFLECYVNDLSAMMFDTDCGNGSQSLLGYVCYNGTTPSSVATYTAHSGCVIVGVASRTCQSNGLWSGTSPDVEPRGLSSLEKGEIAGGVVCYCVSVIILVILAAVITNCCYFQNSKLCQQYLSSLSSRCVKCLFIMGAVTILLPLTMWIFVIVLWVAVDRECRGTHHSGLIHAALALSLCALFSSPVMVFVVSFKKGKCQSNLQPSPNESSNNKGCSQSQHGEQESEI